MQLLKTSNYYGPALDNDDLLVPPITHGFDLDFKPFPVALNSDHDTSIAYPTVTRINAYPSSLVFTVVIPYPHV
jgi:hypothetical protein